jgi:hypothetical protein
MSRMLALTLLLVPFLSGCGMFASSDTWPQFRGPGGSASVPNQRIPDRFGPDENLIWKSAVPAGNSSPAVWGDHIYLTGYKGEVHQVLCLRRSDGQVVWVKEFPVRSKEDYLHRDSSPASPTICVDANVCTPTSALTVSSLSTTAEIAFGRGSSPRRAGLLEPARHRSSLAMRSTSCAT